MLVMRPGVVARGGGRRVKGSSQWKRVLRGQLKVPLNQREGVSSPGRG